MNAAREKETQDGASFSLFNHCLTSTILTPGATFFIAIVASERISVAAFAAVGDPRMRKEQGLCRRRVQLLVLKGLYLVVPCPRQSVLKQPQNRRLRLTIKKSLYHPRQAGRWRQSSARNAVPGIVLALLRAASGSDQTIRQPSPVGSTSMKIIFPHDRVADRRSVNRSAAFWRRAANFLAR